MHISQEHIIDLFLANQARILYAAEGKLEPAYLSLMLQVPSNFFAQPEPHSLFDFQARELSAARTGQHFNPEEHEIGSEAFKAYEAATELAKVCIYVIEATLCRDLEAKADRVQAMGFALTLGESIYRRVSEPSKHYPLRDLYDTALDRASVVRRDLVQGDLAGILEERGAFDEIPEQRN